MDTPATRAQQINDVAQQIIPALLLLFTGLNRAYAHRANELEDSDDEDGEYEEGELEDEDDDIDEDGQQYLEKLEKSANEEDDSDDDDEYDEAEETALESYETPLDKDDCPVDEFNIFKTLISTIEQSDPGWYQALTAHLNQEQRKEVDGVFKMADQRRAAAESKKIQEAGGYVFTQQQVPNAFNFGGAQ